MAERILILGGYGNFGKRIAAALCRKRLPVIIAGRRLDRAEALARALPAGLATAVRCDVTQPLDDLLQELRPGVVVNTCGPFQARDYAVAQACIRTRTHYVDLADGRAFVTGVAALDAEAAEADVAVIAGASTVPGLSSAVLEKYAPEFAIIDSLVYGISPGQKAERGLATTQGIMTYVGKPLKPFKSFSDPVYGWQDIYLQKYPEIGRRWMANCDIPDLDLLPERYAIGKLRFSAGLELSLLHLGLWGLSWLVRAGVPLDLPRHAAPLLKASNWFDIFGSPHGGMHMIIEGKDGTGARHSRSWFIIARDGDGPHIPTVPAILLAEGLATGAFTRRGAMPCVALVTLEDYLRELESLAVKTFTWRGA